MGRDDKTWRDSPVVKGLKIFFCPLVMLWVGFYVYVVPCCTAYCIRAYLRLFNKCCGCACCKFRDKAFPAEPASIGTVEALMKMSVGGAGKAGDVSVVNKLADAMKGGGGSSQIVWRRAADIACLGGPKVLMRGEKKPKPCLFSGGIDATDIQQGELGDCWLMSALACLAERRGAIEGLFETKQFNPFGKYKVRLFLHGHWQTVVVDDYFPVWSGSGNPVFAGPQPKSRELWVMVLEKAFAKAMGSYAALEGGHVVFALEAMTGNDVLAFRKKKRKKKKRRKKKKKSHTDKGGGGDQHTEGHESHWDRVDLVHSSLHQRQQAKRVGHWVAQPELRDEGRRFDADEVWRLLRIYHAKKCLLAASSAGVADGGDVGADNEHGNDDNNNGGGSAVLDAVDCPELGDALDPLSGTAGGNGGPAGDDGPAGDGAHEETKKHSRHSAHKKRKKTHTDPGSGGGGGAGNPAAANSKATSKSKKKKTHKAAQQHAAAVDSAAMRKVGLVPGHAYTVLRVYEKKRKDKGDLRLLKLRNPWGTFEWTGAWSDGAPEWKKHKMVKMALRPKFDREDGIFWMAWDDFCLRFTKLHVCVRARGMGDLALTVREDLGDCVGPVSGCARGCCRYWLCCDGVCAIYCGHDHGAELGMEEVQTVDEKKHSYGDGHHHHTHVAHGKAKGPKKKKMEIV